MATSIKQILTQAFHRLRNISETPLLDAQVVVAHILGKPRSWIIAHPEFQPENYQTEKINQALQRLEQGEPLPYIIGHWEFYNLDFVVTPDVLIPRPETEQLVERCIRWLRLHPSRRCAIDVGTGSGCVGISVALLIPDLRLTLTDISPSALDVARANANKYDLTSRLDFQQADLLVGISEVYDLICANLPYIPSEVLRRLPVAKTEPLAALDGGQSGTDLIFKLLDQSKKYLAYGGLLLMEIEENQGQEVASFARVLYPASKIKLHQDLSGKDRILELERTRLLLHLCTEEEWRNAETQGAFSDRSLENDGFIHCSTPEQILQVANRFYQGIPNLVLLWIDPELITSEIRWEKAGDERFPHIYGPINLPAVIKVTGLNPDEGRKFSLIPSPE